MAQIFHRSANTISRVTIFGAIFIAGFILWVIGGIEYCVFWMLCCIALAMLTWPQVAIGRLGGS